MTQGYKMSYGIILLLALCQLARISSAKPEYSGFLGCTFSPAVCNKDEQCVDDRLFGNCQSYFEEPDTYQYFLNERQLRDLEAEVESLLDEGYTWRSLYTQCQLGSVLLAYRMNINYDPDFCKPQKRVDEPDWEADLTEETLALLQKYFADYYDATPDDGSYPDSSSTAVGEPIDYDEGGAEDTIDVDSEPQVSQEYPYYADSDNYADQEDVILDPLEKKDEFVDVHKYLKSHKRDPAYSAEAPDYEYEDYEDLLSKLKPDDLQLLADYLDLIEDEAAEDEEMRNSAEAAEEEYGSEEAAEPIYPDYSAYDNAVGVEDGVPMEDVASQDDQGWQEEEADALVRPLEAPSVENNENYVPDAENMAIPGEQPSMPEFMDMTPEDAELIGGLLQGTIKVSELSTPQIERLTRYVDSMLRTLGQIQTETRRQDEDGGDLSLAELLMPAAEEKLEEAVKKEQNNFDVLTNPQADSRWQVMVEQKREPAADMEDDDPHDKSFDDPLPDVTPQPKYDFLDANFAYIQVVPKDITLPDAQGLVTDLESALELPPQTFTDVSLNEDGEIDFKVEANDKNLNASMVATLARANSELLKNRSGYEIVKAGIGHDQTKVGIEAVTSNVDGPKYFVLTFVLCGCIAGLVLAGIALYVLRRHARSKDKLAQITGTAGTSGTGDATNGQGEASKDYQDLCRQRMQSKSSEKPEPLHVAARVGSTGEQSVRSPSSRSSTSSWSEEPVQSNMDISTGHIVLSYMEDHMKNKDRLEEEWRALCNYEAEPNAAATANNTNNMRKNRYSDLVPYDHSRVVLSTTTNVASSDYVNASTITDHDPRSPAYIATQGPLPHTVADFWQMVWEQGSVVIVNLTKLTENGNAMCHRYWPEEGSDLYHIYEVHLVSEHIWCPEYLVRSFYLKNLQTNETRTVTQFHFLAWPDLAIPEAGSQGLKALLDFRRKVNKSYRGRSCPIIVHCNDGAGRTGAYCLIDMVLNRMSKGAKEIDIAATLEHIRDQRMRMVKTKEQFEFCLASVAEEVHAILKALPQ